MIVLGALVLGAPCVLPGQAVPVTGTMVHGGEGNRPLAGEWVWLLAIRQDSSGAADSARTDAAGRFRLTLERPDHAAVYVVITNYQGVEYFSGALPIEGSRPIRTEPLVVYDTTSAGPPVRLEGRFFTIFRHGESSGGGGRLVLEIVQVANPGTRTRIAPDTVTPVWKVALPDGASGWLSRGGNLPPQAIAVASDTMSVFAPIWPGASRYASYQYVLRGRTVRLPFDQWTGILSLLLEDTTAEVSGAPLTPLGVHEVEGRRFASYRGGPFEAGAELRVRFPRGPLTAEQAVPFIAGVAALALAWGLWVALKRKPHVPGR